MKLTKSYTACISGNAGKIKYITDTLATLQELSDFIFSLGIEKWRDSKELYSICRIQFPSLNSKVIQNFLRYKYKLIKGKPNPKKPVRASMILDYQNFDVQFTDSKLSSLWIRFHRRNFPVLGKYLYKRIEDPRNIRLVEIYTRNNRLYIKLVQVREVEEQQTSSNENVVAYDTNTKCVVNSDNEFFSWKRIYHRKLEFRKNKQRSRNISNFTRDILHKLTSSLVRRCSDKEQEVLVLEDLTNLRKGKTKRNGGKKYNFVIHSFPFAMFRSMLEYKCAEKGIRLKLINPAYTSKRCNRCGSLHTERPVQNSFTCLDCGYRQHADLNAARNIRDTYMDREWAASESGPSELTEKPPALAGV